MTYNYVSLDVHWDVDNWYQDDERPSGSRPKVTVTRPSDMQQFIFKNPKTHRNDQLWSELIASFIAGDLLGWDVQHCSIGVRNGQPGNLLKYIYSNQERMIEGWQLCLEVDPEYDLAAGHRHTIPLLHQTFDNVAGPTWNLQEHAYYLYWSKALAFDTLISNSDRHAENWAIIVDTDDRTRMAPLYDNGTSLGCQMENIALSKCFDAQGGIIQSKLQKFEAHGRHHVRISVPGHVGGNFQEVSDHWLSIHPEFRYVFEQVASIDLDAVAEFLIKCHDNVKIHPEFNLSQRRVEHMCAILQLGRERIRNSLNKI